MYGPHELRQGPARPARARLARRGAVRGFATSRSACAREPRLELADRAVRAASGDGAEAFVQVGALRARALRGSKVHQPTLIENATVTLRVVRDGRVGMRADEPRRRGRPARGGRARRRGRRRRARPIPASPASPRPAESPRSKAGTRRPPRSTPEDLAGSPGPRSSAARGIGLYGYVTSGVTELAVASTTGLAVDAAMTDAIGARARRRRRDSGYAERPRGAIGDARPGRGRARGGAKTAARTRDAATSSTPGRTAPCSSPGRSPSSSATSTSARSARSALVEGRSYLSGRIGEQVFDRASTIRDDALDPAGMPKAFDFEGVPKQPVHDRRGRRGARRRLGPPHGARASGDASSTGHALPVSAQTYGPAAFNLSVGRGDAGSLDELAELVGDGIYVTRLHYLSTVDAREAIITGMTRDGTFRIEDGKHRRAAREPALHDVVRAGAAVPRLLGPDARGRSLNASDFYGERYPFAVARPGASRPRLHDRRAPARRPGS